MIRAICQRKKWMTRRIIPQRILDKRADYEANCSMIGPVGGSGCMEPTRDFFMRYCRFRPPDEFYEGDILWVRETWWGFPVNDFELTMGPLKGYNRVGKMDYIYRADDKSNNPDDRWKPSIFMPREACRIFLKVVSSRCEHLQDITEEDAIAEGVETQGSSDAVGAVQVPGFRGGFAALWDSLNSKRGYGWYKNLWVYVVEFELDEVRSKLPVFERQGA
jgi:hypothetical protein